MTAKLAHVTTDLAWSKLQAEKADSRTNEINQLNRSIFVPVVRWEKDRRKQEEKIKKDHEEMVQQHETAAIQARETHNRRREAFHRDDEDDQEGIGRHKLLSPEEEAQKKAQRSRFQFEADKDDDDLEDELDDNLDEISEVTKRLKTLGQAMGRELDAQNKRLETMTGQVDRLDSRLIRNTEKVSAVKHPQRGFR
jgi:protein transport protein SEC9